MLFFKKNTGLTAMSTSIDTISQQKLKVSHVAHFLTSVQRQNIGIQAIQGDNPIAHVAERYGVSRKFVYQQKKKALEGISKAFENQPSNDKILFHIPVTKQWLSQVALALIFICRASYQGVSEFFRDILDCHISKGTVHNIVREHLEKSKKINAQQDLSDVQEGLHDEIYQCGNPVLVGCCARSTYCYLLSLEETCDANAWGVHLLDLEEKQKLSPNFTVIDGGKAARCGQREAWPEIPAHGDVFHALNPFLEMVTYLENRALSTLKMVEDFRHKIMERRGQWKDTDKRMVLYEKLLMAEKASENALILAEDVKTLYDWLKNDALALIGPSYDVRQELLAFIAEELRVREHLSHKITPMRTYLENHKSNLLEFMPIMESSFDTIACESEVDLLAVFGMYELKGLSPLSPRYWQKHAELQKELKGKFHWIASLVDDVLKITVRANSLVENLNSRLRTYFTLRRELGNEYLSFLQFFLNHRRFMRSEYAERVGKSPAELLNGRQHQHWLEMLGFQLFKKSASEMDTKDIDGQGLVKYVSMELPEGPSSLAEKLKTAA
jgi:hypothetical protein